MQPGGHYYLTNIVVKDGDTISAECEGKRIEIRLRGIDAPETDQAYGEESEYYLVSLLSDVRYPSTKLIVTSTSDHYGRVIGFVHRENDRGQAINVNLEMVASGLAYRYEEYGGDTPEFLGAEEYAKENGFGVWQAGLHGEEKPWDKRNADPITRLGNWLGRTIGNFWDG